MNWLAHLALSGDCFETQLGNLVCDWVRGQPWDGATHNVRRGFECHYLIDSFTDEHPTILALKSKMPESLRAYRGAVLDVILDYALCTRWNSLYEVSRHEFLICFWNRLKGDDAKCSYIESLPDRIADSLIALQRSDRLNAYGTFDGVGDTLVRMSSRIEKKNGRSMDLSVGLDFLKEHEGEVLAAFDTFYPEIQATLAPRLHSE